MTLPTLPIPDLDETLARYLQWVQPLLNETDYRQTREEVAAFTATDGELLQQDLHDFAEQQNALGKSWLSDAWLTSYLTVREPLPLSTNVTFRLSLDLPGEQLTQLAYLIAGLSRQFADYLNGELADHISPRGEALDTQQWHFLRGMGRIPQQYCDRYEMAPTDLQARHIIALFRGKAYSVRVLDEQHHLRSVEHILTQLQWITKQCPTPDCVFDLPKAPAEQAAVIMQQLAQSEVNEANFALLAHSLFHVHLDDTAFADDRESLREYAFLANKSLWAYKPLTLCANLQNNNLFMHFEHGSCDAGAIQTILTRAVKTAQSLPLQASSASIDAPSPQALAWEIDLKQQQQLSQINKSYADNAKHYQVSIVSVPFEIKSLPEKTSIDFIMQLLMQYAQLKTFGDIRNTYEAVDVSHYQAGRTECVRPVSLESVAFIHALSKEQATLTAFNRAHQAHRNSIKACKQGHGVNRHMLGLELMAKQRHIEPAIFSDIGYQIFTADFLSTSSLGNRKILGDFAFTPSVTGGLGISYFISDDKRGFHYCISYYDAQTDAVGTFQSALAQAAKHLMAFFQNAS